MPGPASNCWQRAGENAIRRSANQEAMGHLSTGLAQVVQLADTTDRAKQELALCRLLGQASFAARGYASPEARAAFSRARELCAALNDSVNVSPVLLGVWLFELAGGRHADAMIAAAEVLTQAQRTSSRGALLAGNVCQGISLLHIGEAARARRNFAAALDCCRNIDDAEASRIAYDYGIEVTAPGYAYSAWCFWLLGHADQALRMGDEALAAAERVKHSYSLSRVSYWGSVLHAYRREWPMVEALATAAIASAQQRGLAMVVAAGRVMRGSAQVMRDPRGECLNEIREGLAAYRATGARFQTTYYLVLLAQALAACGRHSEGLAAVRDAAALAEETDERFVEPEIHRVQGNLLLAASGTVEAEVCYERALEIAQAQGARSFELRAVTDLARLWAARGDRTEAADLLAPMYGSFTEGFDTADLKEAKALLDALAL